MEKIFNKVTPLVLAGVEYEIPIYKKHYGYNNIWEKSLVTSNREYQDSLLMWRRSCNLTFDRRLKALEMYGNKSATEHIQ